MERRRRHTYVCAIWLRRKKHKNTSELSSRISIWHHQSSTVGWAKTCLMPRLQQYIPQMFTCVKTSIVFLRTLRSHTSQYAQGCCQATQRVNETIYHPFQSHYSRVSVPPSLLPITALWNKLQFSRLTDVLRPLPNTVQRTRLLFVLIRGHHEDWSLTSKPHYTPINTRQWNKQDNTDNAATVSCQRWSCCVAVTRDSSIIISRSIMFKISHRGCFWMLIISR